MNFWTTQLTGNLLKVRKEIYLIAAAGWTIFITVLSLVSFSGTTTIKSPVSDKLVHAVFYLAFTLLWYSYLKERRKKYILLKLFLTAVVYGIIIEVLQYMMPYGRNFDTKDILANTAGGFLGIILIKIYEIRSGIALKRKN